MLTMFTKMPVILLCHVKKIGLSVYTSDCCFLLLRSVVAFYVEFNWLSTPPRHSQCSLCLTCLSSTVSSRRLSFLAVVYCGPPKVPRSIMIMGRSFHYGDRIAYMCRSGLLPASEPILTCLGNGKWDKQPACRGRAVGTRPIK